MSPIVNISAYKFVTLDELPKRREALLARCRELGLKGTILLSTEGINCFLAGTREAIDAFLSQLKAEPEFTDLEAKESFSDRQPFTRLLVRIKKEIIAFGVEGIEPAEHTSPRVTPKELKRWLDEGQDVTLVDTRNDYEYALGTFANAVKLDLQDFRHFPEVVARLPQEMRKQKVVSFCTGGIRCEKAAPLMERVGFENVYQLDGGILKYFEECGGEHYEGDCFVFDQRVALDPNLEETETTLCYACQATLSKEDRASPLYVPGRQCPHCYRTPEEQSSRLCRERAARLVEVIEPLPGSQPYENRRPLSVPARLDRCRTIEFLDAMNTIHSREEWLEFCRAGRVRMNNRAMDPEQIVRAGMRLELVTPATTEPPVDAAIEFLFEDDHIVVLNKPAPLPMHPCGRFNRNSLQYLLEQVYPDRKVRPAHRLDANTAGIVVCSKTRAVARHLQPQFANGEVRKVYLARVHGHPAADTFESRASISREPNTTGARVVDPDGLPAHTRFEVIERRPDETSLLRVMPVTGRTNQIRVHLWDADHRIVGDPLYLGDHSLGQQQTLAPEADPMCLHAAELEFRHPVEGDVRKFSTAPAWLKLLCLALLLFLPSLQAQNSLWPKRVKSEKLELKNVTGLAPKDLGRHGPCRILLLSADSYLVVTEHAKARNNPGLVPVTHQGGRFALPMSRYNGSKAHLKRTSAAKPKGLFIYLTGIIGLTATENKLVETFRSAGWHTLVSETSFNFFRRRYVLVEPKKRNAQAKQLGQEVNDHLADKAYAVEAMFAFLRAKHPDMLKGKRILAGGSAGSIALPSVAARTGMPDAMILVGAGGNASRIVCESSLAPITLYKHENRLGNTTRVVLPNREVKEFHRLMHAQVPLDALRLAPRFKNVPILMLRGELDEMVPVATNDLLHDALGKPERWSYPVNHIFLFGTLQFQSGLILQWAERKLTLADAN